MTEYRVRLTVDGVDVFANNDDENPTFPAVHEAEDAARRWAVAAIQAGAKSVAWHVEQVA